MTRDRTATRTLLQIVFAFLLLVAAICHLGCAKFNPLLAGEVDQSKRDSEGELFLPDDSEFTDITGDQGTNNLNDGAVLPPTTGDEESPDDSGNRRRN